MYKRKKNTRMRAKTTHGYGSMKKNRGAGNRGGRGNAGSGKRGDAKKQSYPKDYFGKKGFTLKRPSIQTINICDLNRNIDILVKKGVCIVENDMHIIDLTKAGYDKLLGKGKPEKKYQITVDNATSKAIEKIKSVGKIIVKNVPVEDNS